MVEAVLESLHEWATDRGFDLGPDSNLPLWDARGPTTTGPWGRWCGRGRGEAIQPRRQDRRVPSTSVALLNVCQAPPTRETSLAAEKRREGLKGTVCRRQSRSFLSIASRAKLQSWTMLHLPRTIQCTLQLALARPTFRRHLRKNSPTKPNLCDNELVLTSWERSRLSRNGPVGTRRCSSWRSRSCTPAFLTDSSGRWIRKRAS